MSLVAVGTLREEREGLMHNGFFLFLFYFVDIAVMLQGVSCLRNLLINVWYIGAEVRFLPLV